jgi:DNA-binding protein H-NS
MELSKMSLGDLRNLQDAIKQEMKRREHQEVAKAREQILAIAQSVGVPLKDLISVGRGSKTGTVPVRYRHPDHSTQQWTGRGRQPKWVKEWVDSGKTMDALRV